LLVDLTVLSKHSSTVYR